MLAETSGGHFSSFEPILSVAITSLQTQCSSHMMQLGPQLGNHHAAALHLQLPERHLKMRAQIIQKSCFCRQPWGVGENNKGCAAGGKGSQSVKQSCKWSRGG